MSKPVNVAELRPSEALDGKKILLSGTTGFLGKVVLCMLLYRYPKIGKVYALIRPGVSERARDRFNKGVATSPAMRPLVERHGEQIAAFFEEKVVPIDGNVTKPDCGIDAETLALLEREGLDLIINSAGLVDFDPPVDQALGINAHGAQNVVKLARRLNAGLLHVSTCFVAGTKNGQIVEDDPVLNRLPDAAKGDGEDFDHEREIARLEELANEVRARADDAAQRAAWRAEAKQRLEEEGRDPGDPSTLKNAILRQRKSWMNKELRNIGMERARFWGWTNTYTFTKSLGEQVIAKAVSEGLNACIVRPAIVESSLEFPFPGWNEGFTTTAPLILLTRNGLPHFPYAEDLILDVVPVDMVAGVIIAAAAALLAGPHKLVYQVATGDVNPLTIRQGIELTGLGTRLDVRRKGKKGFKNWWLRHNEMQPMSKSAFTAMSVPLYKKAAGQILRALDKLGPDRFAWIRQPASGLRDLAEELEKGGGRIETVLELFMPFVAENKYIFRGDNTRQLMSRIPEPERAELHYDPSKFVWREYFSDVHIPGLETWIFPKLEEELAEKPKEAYVYRNLTELFETTTRRHRHKVAFSYLRKNDDEYLTYGELRALAFRVAGFLDAQGVKAEERVLLVCENRPEWVAGYFGILLAGATAVPVDANAKAEEIVNIARAAEARGVLISPRTGRRLVGEGADPEALASSGAALWMLEQAVRHPATLERSRDPARLASIIFTSGTTGKPKGVMLTQRNFTFEVSRLLGIFDLGANDHLLSVLPLHHTFEFTAGLLTPLSRGARVTYMSMLDGDMLARALRQGVSGLIGVPALWQLLQRRIEGQLEDAGLLPELVVKGVSEVNAFLRQYFDLNLGPLAAYPVHRKLGGRLKHLVSGGSALSPDVMEFFRGLGFNLTEGYGLTETAPVLTVTNPKHKLKAGSVGKPLSGVELKIDAPNEEGIGEVLARGPNVMAGYFGNDEATAAVLADGWLRTGDLGRMDEEGRLYLVGRKKDVIVDADGRNVYPDEIEELYADHPLIKEMSIVGLTQGTTERVAALVVPKYDGAEEREAVRQTVARHIRNVSDSLAYYKRIKILHFFDGELPRTATKKVKRPEVVKVLKALTESSEQLQSARPSGSGTPLGLVAGVVAALSGKPAAEITADTRLAADLGFDSLMYVELASALEPHIKGDVTSEQLMAIERVGDILALLGKREAVQRLGGQGSASIAGHRRRASLEEAAAYPVPASLASLGKSVLGLGQQAFYEKVMNVEVRGRQYIPRHGGFLVAANHASHLDAGLVKTALGAYGKSLVALAAKDYFFGSKLRRTYFETFTNVMPIERSGNVKESLRQATDALERGSTLLIFPEGTRSEDGRIQEFKASLGYLALSAKAPVLPMYLWGTYEAMPKGSTLLPASRRIGAIIGPPIERAVIERVVAGLPRSEAYRVATVLVQRAVEALRDRGTYAALELATAVAAEVRAAPQPLLPEHVEEEPAVETASAEAAAEGNGARAGNGKRSNGKKTNGKVKAKRPAVRKAAGKPPSPAEEVV